MKYLFDKKGNIKGEHITLKDLESEYLYSVMESFVRHGCYLYRDKQGIIGAIPGNMATLKDIPSWEEVSKSIERSDSEHCAALDFEKIAAEQEGNQ